MFTLPIEAIVSKNRKDLPKYNREQHCMGCRTVLAMQLTDNLEDTHAGEHWVAKEAIWLKGEQHVLYAKERWYGNMIICPVCHRQGVLPIDKPYNWELIQTAKEERYAVQN